MHLDIFKKMYIHGIFSFIVDYVFASFHICGNLHICIKVIYAKFHMLVTQRHGYSKI